MKNVNDRLSSKDYKLWVNTEKKEGSVILIHPFVTETRIKNRNYSTESLTLNCLMGSLVKAGFSCVAINSEMKQWDAIETVNHVITYKDIFMVGISCKSERAYGEAKKMAMLIKQRFPKVHITIGGILATVADEIILNDCSYFDSVSRGEGEYLITELAYKLLYQYPLSDIKSLTVRNGNHIVCNPMRKRIQNLDEMPFAFRNEMQECKENGKKQLSSAYMFTSRGCFGSCSFCSIHQLLGEHIVKKRSPQNVIREMENIIEKYNITEFYFIDDLFILPSEQGEKWIDSFCSLIKKKKMKIKFHIEIRADTVKADILTKLIESGLFRIFIGAESGSDTVLRRWNKKCTVLQNNKALFELEKTGIPKHQIELGYIMFDPMMSYSELKENYYWIKKSGLCTVQNLQNRMNVYYGTQIYNELIQNYKLVPPKFGESWINKFYADKYVEFVESTLRKMRKKLYNDSNGLLGGLFGVLDNYKNQIGFFGYAKDHEFSNANMKINNILYSIYKFINKLEREIYFYVFEKSFDFIDGGFKNIPFLEHELEKGVLEKAKILKSIAIYFQSIIDAYVSDTLQLKQIENFYIVNVNPCCYFKVQLKEKYNDKFDCNVEIVTNLG